MKEFSLAKAALIVLSFHLAAILWLVFFSDAPIPLKPRARLTVQTVSLTPKTEPVAIATPQQTPEVTPPIEAPEPPPPPPPKPKPAPPPKKPAVTPKPKEPPKKSEPPKKQEPPKPTPPPPVVKVDPRKKELIAKAQESIAKIQQNRATFKAELADSKDSTTDLIPGYRDELVARLQMMLRLPERGDVRIKLTLSRTGKVVKMEILNADSAVNRKYVEKSMPTIQFPPFGKELGNAAENSFNITLSSEI